jgi:hypothetical protein
MHNFIEIYCNEGDYFDQVNLNTYQIKLLQKKIKTLYEDKFVDDINLILDFKYIQKNDEIIERE